MSLINDVLRDLDQRNAAQAARDGILHDVRPLPPAGAPAWRMPAIATAIAVLLVILVWTMWPIHEPALQGTTPAVPGPIAMPDAQPAPATKDVPPPEPTPALTPQAPAAPVSAPSTTTAVLPPLYFEETPLPATQAAAPAQAAAPQAARSGTPAPANGRPAARGDGRLRLDGHLRTPAASPPVLPAGDEWNRLQTSLRGASPAAAEASLGSFLASHPGHAAARQSLVGLLLQGNRLTEAVPILREGLATAPEQIGWAMTLARIQAGTNEYPAAFDTLSRSAPHARDQPDYQAFLGTVLQRLERPVDAIAHYEVALRAKPQEARWWVGYGIALEQAGRQADSREALARARTIGGLSPEIRQFVDERLR